MEILDSSRFGPLNEQALNEFEKKYSIKFPAAYRSFLLNHNGGSPRPNCNPTPETDVNWIYGIHSGPNWARLGDTIECFKGRIPQGAIPIASDSFGNQFLLFLNDDNYGEVWFWDHELEGNGDDYPGYIIKSATSFEDFLQGMYEWIDPDETAAQRILRTNDVEAVKELLNSGWDFDQQDRYGRRMIENASIRNRLEIVKLLVHNGKLPYNSLRLAVQNQKAFPTRGYGDLVDFLRSLNPKLKS